MRQIDIGIGDRLELIRADLRKTQKEFADALDISRSAYVHYKNGKSCVPHKLVAILVSDYGIDAHWLLTGTAIHANDRNFQLVKDTLFLGNLIVKYAERNGITLTEAYVADIVQTLVTEREGRDQTALYDRGRLKELVRKKAAD